MASAWAGQWPESNNLVVEHSLAGANQATTEERVEELSTEQQEFLRQLEEVTNIDSREDDDSLQNMQDWFEEQMHLRWELLGHVCDYHNETLTHTAADALRDLLDDATPELTFELLETIFELSNYWPQRIAADLLGLSTEQDYSFEELIREFEERERINGEAKDHKPNWKEEGF